MAQMYRVFVGCFFFSFLSIESKISNLCSNHLMVHRENISVEISCTSDLLSVYLTKKLLIRLYDAVRHIEVNFLKKFLPLLSISV